MEKYLTWLLDNGAQSISICGSTGENVAMNMEEQREIRGYVPRRRWFNLDNSLQPTLCTNTD